MHNAPSVLCRALAGRTRWVDLRDHPLVPLARLAETKKVHQLPTLRRNRVHRARSRLRRPHRMPTPGPCSSFRCSRRANLIGAIVIYRQEVALHSPTSADRAGHEFASQAVIAIENTRLLASQRKLNGVAGAADRDFGGAQVISSSPGRLEPVFEAMLDKCRAHLRSQVRGVVARRGRRASGRLRCTACRQPTSRTAATRTGDPSRPRRPAKPSFAHETGGAHRRPEGGRGIHQGLPAAQGGGG